MRGLGDRGAAFHRERWARRKNAVVERVPLVDAVSRVVALKRGGNASEHVGLCPFHNEKTPSFTLNTRKGFYHCFGCGAHGSNAVDFVMARNGLDFAAALELLEGENGLGAFAASAPPPPPPQARQVEDLDKAAKVRRIAEATREIVPGDPVDRYLRGRAMLPPAEYGFGDAGVNAGWPPALRFAPRCWHGSERREMPAMVAAMRRPDGTLGAVHRTYLVERGGAVVKAGTESDKRMFGDPKGCWILLGPIAERMTGGEGIETSLSAMQLFGRSGLAFGTCGGMATVEPPFECADFVYAADKNKRHADPKRSRVGERAAWRAVKAFGVGRKMAVKVPNLPDETADFNDVLVAQRQARAGVHGTSDPERRSEGP